MPGIQLAGASEALDASLNTVITEFHLLRDEIPKIKNIATPMTLPPHSGRSKVLLDYGRLEARNLSDGVPIAEAQDLADAQTLWTPNEVGLMVLLARTTVRRVADPDLDRQVGRMMAAAYNLKEDQDGTALFDDFTISLGAAGTILSPGLISAAVTQISVGGSVAVPEPAPEPYYGVFHPCSVHSVANRLIPMTDVPTGTTAYAPTTTTGVTVGPGRTSLGDRILQQGSSAVGRLSGATIISSANIAVDAANDAECVVMSKEGFIYIEEFPPQEDTEADIALRGKKLVMAGSYVFGVYRPAAYGALVTVDAILPTS